MQFKTILFATACATACAAAMAGAASAGETDAAMRGLAPFGALLATPAGRAALAANERVTAAIQDGSADQPLLRPFPAQQAQALRDAFITLGNVAELADGLGTSLGGAYQALAPVTSTDDGIKDKHFGNVAPSVGRLIAYSVMLTGRDAVAGKYLFADGTTDGTKAAPALLIILQAAGGTTDVLGKATGHPAGSPGADPYGDSRPFQTEPKQLDYRDPDYFGVSRANTDYLTGPAQDLRKSPAWPSGHTTYGYTGALLLAVMLPERYPQMIARGAEYGNDRIVLGAHYAMDVIAGRTLASYDLAHLLADDPAYENQTAGKAQPVADFRAALAAARGDLRKALAAKCGGTIAACASQDTSRFANGATLLAFTESTQTYGLPVVYPAQAGHTEDVAAIAPEAGNLLTAAFPTLSLKQADDILTRTEGPGGSFLDDGSGFGVYSRLDLFRAGIAAAQEAQAK